MTPYYSDDLVTIYHGDALGWMPSADVLITDPPYGVAFTGKTYMDEKLGYLSGDSEIGPTVVSRYLVERPSSLSIQSLTTLAACSAPRGWGLAASGIDLGR